MNIENTLRRFRLIADLDNIEAEKWSDLVIESREYLESIVIKDEIFELDEKRLDNAAAVYAYYRYVCYTASNESSFTAGDLKVSFNSKKISSAKEMWEREFNCIRDIVDDNNSAFLFKRVVY